MTNRNLTLCLAAALAVAAAGVLAVPQPAWAGIALTLAQMRAAISAEVTLQLASPFAQTGSTSVVTAPALGSGAFNTILDADGRRWSQNEDGAYDPLFLPLAMISDAGVDEQNGVWGAWGTQTSNDQTVGTATVTTDQTLMPWVDVEDDDSDGDVAIAQGGLMSSKYRPFCMIVFRSVGTPANGRVFVGLTLDHFSHTTSATPTIDHFGLSFDATTPDTNWQFDRWDSAGVQTDTGIAYAADTDWIVHLDLDSSSLGTIRLYKTVSTAGEYGPAEEVWSATVTTQVPSDTTLVGGVSAFNNSDPAADHIGVYRVYMGSQAPGY